ncbi:low-density lipoprotein particle receptor [Mactra antiquata]
MKGRCFVIFLTSVFIDLVTGQCPNGFNYHQQSCYHFSQDEKSWLSALVACQRLFSANLAEIENEQEFQYLQGKSFQRGEKYWIGGDDLQVEGDWRWQSTGQKIPLHIDWWLSGNPSNSYAEENCLELNYQSHQSYLNDLRCYISNRYICEKPA